MEIRVGQVIKQDGKLYQMPVLYENLDDGAHKGSLLEKEKKDYAKHEQSRLHQIQDLMKELINNQGNVIEKVKDLETNKKAKDMKGAKVNKTDADSVLDIKFDEYCMFDFYYSKGNPRRFINIYKNINRILRYFHEMYDENF